MTKKSNETTFYFVPEEDVNTSPETIYDAVSEVVPICGKNIRTIKSEVIDNIEDGLEIDYGGIYKVEVKVTKVVNIKKATVVFENIKECE